MKKEVKICIIALIIVGCILAIYGIHKNNSDKNVSEDYIAVFHGGAGEITYETYIYKINNNKPNMGFKYINQTCTTTYWGSPDWNCKTTKTGTVTWTDDVFVAAKDNYAYSYVTIPGSDKIYMIDEFAEIFLMN